MSVSDEEVIDRIRDTLSRWAQEQPIPAPTWSPPVESTLIELTRAMPEHRPVRRAGWWIAVAAASVLIIAAAVAVSLRDDPAPVVDVGPTPSTIIEIPLGRQFGVRGMAVTDDAVWVASTLDEELYQIDPATNRVVATFPIPAHVEGVRPAGGGVWLSRYEPNELIRLDPATGALTHRLEFESQPNLVADGDRLWVVAERDGQSQVVEIDPRTGAPLEQFPLGGPAGPAMVDGDDLWVAGLGSTTVSRVDLAERRVAARIDVGGEPRSIVATAGAIFVAANDAGPEPTGSVVRIDPSTDQMTASATTGRWVHSLVADDESIWATNFRDGTLSVIDAERMEVAATTPIGNRPGGVAIGDGSVWITPHRRNSLMRLDPSLSLEAAAVPDLARTIDIGSGTVYLRCSGDGSPPAIIPGNTGEGPAWAVVEARLSRTMRVCVYEPVGVADPTEIGQRGPASQVADDLATALAEAGETGPFVVVGDWMGGLSAQVFAATHSDIVAGMVLVHGLSADYFDRVAEVLPTDALDRMNESMRGDPSMQWLDESLAEVSEIDGFGDLPLVVLGDAPADYAAMTANGDPFFYTVAESETIGRLLEETQRELAGRSTSGRFVVADSEVTPDDVVDAVTSLVEGR